MSHSEIITTLQAIINFIWLPIFICAGVAVLWSMFALVRSVGADDPRDY